MGRANWRAFPSTGYAAVDAQVARAGRKIRAVAVPGIEVVVAKRNSLDVALRENSVLRHVGVKTAGLKGELTDSRIDGRTFRVDVIFGRCRISPQHDSFI